MPVSSFSDIKAVLFDIDGVLTDGGIILDHQGNEIKSFHVRDGQMIRFLQSMGLVFGTISGRDALAAKARMKALNIDFIRLGQNDKRVAFETFLSEFSLAPSEVIYLGDDVVDLPILQQAGIAVCPRDASVWVKPYCDMITDAKGGDGVLREVLDVLIKENKWQQKMADFFHYSI